MYPHMFRKYSKEVMLTAETCFIFNMMKIMFSCFFFFMHMELDDVINVKTCHNKRLGNTVCCTDCRNMFHIVIMQCALIHIAPVA
jgi:hypothetical protein